MTNDQIFAQIRDIDNQLIEIYKKVNLLYDLINSVPLDLTSPYYKRAKEMIDNYDYSIKLLNETREDLLKGVKNEQ